MKFFENFDLRQLNNLDLLAKQVVEGFIIGLHKSPFHGFSVEFAEHRIYNPGQSTKKRRVQLGTPSIRRTHWTDASHYFRRSSGRQAQINSLVRYR